MNFKILIVIQINLFFIVIEKIQILIVITKITTGFEFY